MREPRHPLTQVFHDAALERAYRAATARKVRTMTRILGLVAIAGFAVSGVADPIVLGSEANGRVMRVYRLAVGAPLLLAAVSFAWAPQRWFERAWHWVFTAGAATVVVVPLLVAVALPEPGKLVFATSWISLIMVMIVSALAVPTGITRATGLVVLINLVGALVGWRLRSTIPDLNTLLAWIAAAGAMTIFAAYQLNQRDRDAFAAGYRLDAEHARSERLLLNVLPAPIAARLKDTPTRIADRFDDATVLFADIVGFTTLSQRLTPEEIVSALDEVFSAFDDIAAHHQLEKIKTIGDSYMVVGGVPRARADHAHAIAAMALEMRDLIATRRFGAGHQLEVRIGISSGPVVAGVIGKQKFIYDLWGDTVNTASRMESHGVAGSIQVSAQTHAHLDGRFELSARGPIHIKGKGDLPTWLLTGMRA